MGVDELTALTVAELKVRLKELQLPTTGKKADLIERLLESDSVEGDDEDVLILDEEDDEDEPMISEDDEILEAEVFDAEIIDAEEIEAEIEAEIEDTRATHVMRDAPDIPSTPWYKDGMIIATILVVLLLSGVGGWWYYSNEAAAFQSDESRYGDNLQFNVKDGLLLAEGDEMVALLRDALTPSAIDEVCEELRITFSGKGFASITKGSLSDLVDSSETKLEGAVMAKDAYGREWNTVESNLNYDLTAEMSGNTWSAINQDSCSSLEWKRPNNELDIGVTQWHEITEKGLMRSETSVSFVDSEGQTFAAEATTFDGVVNSDSISNLVEGILLPMHPVNIYDIFGIKILEEGQKSDPNEDYQGWGWEIGSTTTIGGQDAIQIRMYHKQIGDCLGRAEMVLWAIPGQPLPAKQSVDISIDKTQQRSCGTIEAEAIDLSFPDGKLVTRYTLEQTSFTRGENPLNWQESYDSRPMSSSGKPPVQDRTQWVTHLPDNSTSRFTLEQAVTCVMTDAQAFGPAHTALNGDGYVFAAKDDRSGDNPIWNLSWVSGNDEAGYVKVTWPGGESCLNTEDGFLSGDDKPEHDREQIPITHKLSTLENRITDSNLYPGLNSDITSSGNLRDDVHIGYTLIVTEENAVSDLLKEFDILSGQVTVYLERSWTTGNTDHSLQVGMDAETGRMIGWIQTSNPS